MTYVLNKIDDYLNTQTMYRLVFQGLMVISLCAIVFGFFGIISYDGLSLIYSLCTLLLACYATNYVCATLVSAQRNYESVFITALILFLILSPASDMIGLSLLALAGSIAMASKYLLAVHMKHIFNPAGVSVLIMGLFGFSGVLWWVATPPLTGIVCVLGFLVLRKLDRFRLFFSFAGSALVFISFFALRGGAPLVSTLSQVFFSWPLIFFGTIMLTEPLSMPPTVKQQTIYAVLVGILFGSQFSFGPLYSTPQLALIVGNIYTFAVSPKYFSKLILQTKQEIARGIYEFAFTSSKKLKNIPGQYIEWTLPHSSVDTRGTRRYFTVASAPTEDLVKIGIRVSPQNGSSFKKALLLMNPGDSIVASALSGEFVLPKDTRKKLVFIAGGIGVTPFRSIIKYLTDKKEIRDITLLYSNKTVQDIAYKDVFDRAEKEIGAKIVYVINDGDTGSLTGAIHTIDANYIQTHIQDYVACTYYLSGPPGMVQSFEEMLVKIGVKDIKTDFFSGY